MTWDCVPVIPESNGVADAVALMEQLPDWLEDYNKNHPHSARKMRSPREFRRRSDKLEACLV